MISGNIFFFSAGISSVQLLSYVWLFNPMDCSMLGFLSFTISQSLLKLISIESMMLPNHLSLPSPPASILPSIRVISNESVLLTRWQNYKSFSFSFSISPSNEHSGMISFRIDWLDLLAVQGTLKSSPTSQFKSISSSALSLLYGPTLTSIHDCRKNHSLDYMDLCWQSNVSAF